MSQTLRIGQRIIGQGQPVYIIAEMSANHRGDFSEASAIVRAAAAAGADAIKLQTYTADTMTLPIKDGPFRVGQGTLWEGRSLHELYEEASTPWAWYPKLKQVADEAGIEIFSTAFDETAVRFLEEQNVPVHKVASFELVDIPLIRAMAATGKPMILSTGMASIQEIEEAVKAARDAGAGPLALLKCTSAYPAPPEEMNLRTLHDLAARFDCPVGLSDHTLGPETAVAAVVLGACIVEKHFTLSRSAGGPDAVFSAEPGEFRDMVNAIRNVEKALGEVRYGGGEKQEKHLAFRRSLFAASDIAEGEAFTRDNVRSIRPGGGLAPKHYDKILGSIATQDIPMGTPLSWKLISDE